MFVATERSHMRTRTKQESLSHDPQYTTKKIGV